MATALSSHCDPCNSLLAICDRAHSGRRCEPARSMTNLFDLTGRTTVVTGSAQSMGRAMAIALAEAGADLVLLAGSEAGIDRRLPVRSSPSWQCW
jgi:hypothetical protein